MKTYTVQANNVEEAIDLLRKMDNSNQVLVTNLEINCSTCVILRYCPYAGDPHNTGESCLLEDTIKAYTALNRR